MVEPNNDETPGDPPETGGERVKRWWNKGHKDPNNMSFLEHLEEFRWVVVKSVLAFIVGAVAMGVLMGDALDVLRRPLLQAFERHGEIVKKLEKVGLGEYAQFLEQEEVSLIQITETADDNDTAQLAAWGIEDASVQEQIIACFDPNDKDNQYLKALTPFAPISVFIQVFFLGGLSVALPFILYFFGQFVIPGLTESEKKTLLPGCIASFFLFLAGACMAYFLILPLSLYFVIMWSNEFGMAWESGAGPYYTMVVWMTIAIGTSFEFPLILVILAWLGVLTTKKMRSSRRIVFVILMVSAALITPGGDPISLSLLTIPMYLLYELAIFCAKRIEKKREKRILAERDVEVSEEV
ncbi:MAG: twin-arginine translocase subunit TatC [Opitutales bacterium]